MAICDCPKLNESKTSENRAMVQSARGLIFLQQWWGVERRHRTIGVAFTTSCTGVLRYHQRIGKQRFELADLEHQHDLERIGAERSNDPDPDYWSQRISKGLNRLAHILSWRLKPFRPDQNCVREKIEAIGNLSEFRRMSVGDPTGRP